MNFYCLFSTRELPVFNNKTNKLKETRSRIPHFVDFWCSRNECSNSFLRKTNTVRPSIHRCAPATDLQFTPRCTAHANVANAGHPAWVPDGEAAVSVGHRGLPGAQPRLFSFC